MISRISLLSIIVACVSCQKNSKSDKELIRSSEWLLGNWEQKTTEGLLVENWTKVNDSTLNATSLFIREKDTIHKETIVLQQTGENLTYKTTIKGQNNDQPILFLSKESLENQLIFENLNNDYPQKISYSKPKENQLLTELSGVQSGKQNTEKYILAKKN
ncbi:DUF6265 family protein [Flavobacterium faecale]|uniref:DUF6265 family protein n=1 Tax=Flavobacterium faecale TaxID=1355330 RepID=UPI003AAC27F1